MNFIKKTKAFTLIELLVVVAIIGILAAVGVVAYNGYTSSAKKKTTISNFKMVVKKFKSEMAFCETRESNDFAFSESRSTQNHHLQCKEMISGGVSWKSDVQTALNSYFNKYMNMKNVLSPKRNFFVGGDTFDQDVNLGSVFALAKTNNTIDFYVCFQTPCNNSANRLNVKINRD